MKFESNKEYMGNLSLQNEKNETESLVSQFKFRTNPKLY